MIIVKKNPENHKNLKEQTTTFIWKKIYALVGSVLQPDWLMDKTICAPIILHSLVHVNLSEKDILLSDVSDGHERYISDP